MENALLINKKEYQVNSSYCVEEDFLIVYNCTRMNKQYQVLGIWGEEEPKRKKRLFKNLIALLKLIQRSSLHVYPLVDFDTKELLVVRELIDGVTVLEQLGEDDLPDQLYARLMEIFSLTKSMKLGIDFHPSNFIYKDGELYYTSLTFDDYSEKENLINKSIMLWVYSKQAIEELKKIGIKKDIKRVKPDAVVNKEVVLLVYKHYQI